MAVVGRVPSPGVTTNSPLMQICLSFPKRAGIHAFLPLHPQSNKQRRPVSLKKRPQIPNTASFTGWGRVPSAVLQGFAHWTGPAKPCAHGSVQPAIVRFFIHAEVGFHVMCGDRLLVQRVGGLWGTEKHNGNIFAQGPTQGYFRSSLKATDCPSLPSHIGHVSVHSGSVKTLSSRERWWPISRQPTVPLPPGGYCPPLQAEPWGHLSQCHTLKGQKSGLLQQQSQPEINTSVNC